MSFFEQVQNIANQLKRNQETRDKRFGSHPYYIDVEGEDWEDLFNRRQFAFDRRNSKVKNEEDKYLYNAVEVEIPKPKRVKKQPVPVATQLSDNLEGQVSGPRVYNTYIRGPEAANGVYWAENLEEATEAWNRNQAQLERLIHERETAIAGREERAAAERRMIDAIVFPISQKSEQEVEQIRTSIISLKTNNPEWKDFSGVNPQDIKALTDKASRTNTVRLSKDKTKLVPKTPKSQAKEMYKVYKVRNQNNPNKFTFEELFPEYGIVFGPKSKPKDFEVGSSFSNWTLQDYKRMAAEDVFKFYHPNEPVTVEKAVTFYDSWIGNPNRIRPPIKPSERDISREYIGEENRAAYLAQKEASLSLHQKVWNQAKRAETKSKNQYNANWLDRYIATGIEGPVHHPFEVILEDEAPGLGPNEENPTEMKDDFEDMEDDFFEDSLI
jgi:hypothetical protein